MVHEHTVSNKAKPYAARRCREMLSCMVEAHFLNRDIGEPNIADDSLWMMDDEPACSSPDSWARGSVPVQSRRRSTIGHFNMASDLAAYQATLPYSLAESAEERDEYAANQDYAEAGRVASAGSITSSKPLDAPAVVRSYHRVKNDKRHLKLVIAEVKSMGKPPEGMIVCMEAVCVLHGMELKQASSHKNRLKMFRDPGLLFEMQTSNPLEAPANMALIRDRYTSNPDFNPTAMALVGSAAGIMCAWVHLHEQYERVFASMTPDEFTALEEQVLARMALETQEALAESRRTLQRAASEKELAKSQERDFNVEKVEAMFEKAMQAVSELGTGHLRELRRFTTPPKEVAEVLEAVMILKGGTPNWLSAKKALGVAFVSELLEYDTDQVTEQTLSLLARYEWVVSKTYKPEIVFATLCPPAGAICMWVRAIYVYCRALLCAGPKTIILREAVKTVTQQRELRQTATALNMSGTTSRLVFMNGGKQLVGVDLKHSGKPTKRVVPGIAIGEPAYPKSHHSNRIRAKIRPTPPKQPNNTSTSRSLRRRPTSEVGS